MPALVSCCFVWVSQAVTMTTTSSYWTDVICDIMLNGKGRRDTTKNKKYGTKPAFASLSTINFCPWGKVPKDLESQAAATLSFLKSRQC